MLKGKEWYDDHLKSFVIPVLGKIPKLLNNNYLTTNQSLKMLKVEVNLKALLELWAEAKKRAQGRIILLPGRDVWLFEVLARLDGTKTIFRPEISSDTWKWVAAHDPERELFKNCYCVDSGNAGSIPKGLSCVDWGLVYYSMGHHPLHQLIQFNPNFKGPYYDCYCILESIPKYWVRGALTTGPYNVQKIAPTSLNGIGTFTVAVLGTMLVANYWFKVNETKVASRIRLTGLRLKRLKPRILKRPRIRYVDGHSIPTKLKRIR